MIFENYDDYFDRLFNFHNFERMFDSPKYKTKVVTLKEGESIDDFFKRVFDEFGDSSFFNNASTIKETKLTIADLKELHESFEKQERYEDNVILNKAIEKAKKLVVKMKKVATDGDYEKATTLKDEYHEFCNQTINSFKEKETALKNQREIIDLKEKLTNAIEKLDFEGAKEIQIKIDELNGGNKEGKV